MKESKASRIKRIEAILFIMITCCCCCFTCNKPTIELNFFQGVDEELWSFFLMFEQEAAKRGIEIDLSTKEIKGRIAKIHFKKVVGLCSHKIAGKKEIIIDLDYWNKCSESNKEMIVFHELGHCYLGRPHSDKMEANGICGSIMKSDLEDCIDFYNSKSRKFLLDELFLKE